MLNIPSVLTPREKKELKEPVSCPNCKSENIILKTKATKICTVIGTGAGVLGGTAAAIDFLPSVISSGIIGGPIAAISVSIIGVIAVTGTSIFFTSGAGRSIDKTLINCYKCIDCQHEFKGN